MTDIGIEGKLKPLLQNGRIADAIDVETTGSSTAQTDLDNINQSILNWKFNKPAISETNPGATFLAINNANKADATLISINGFTNVTNSVAVHEMLEDLSINDRIYIQERTVTGNTALYRVTGAIVRQGDNFNVPVANERVTGGEWANEALLNVKFFFTATAAGLPDSVVEIQSPTIDASNATTFASSLSGETPGLGDGYRITTGGEPFTGSTVSAEVGDVILSAVSSPSLTTVTDWVILRKADSLSVNALETLFLDEVRQNGLNFGFSNLVKIGRDNLDDALTQDLNRAHNSDLNEQLQDFQQHLTVTHIADTAWTVPPNPTQINSTITRLFASHWDENRIGSTPFTGNYFEDLADPTITLTGGNHFYFADANDINNVNFPGKQSYFTGQLTVSGLPLTNTENKLIGFSHYIRDETFATDVTLLQFGSRIMLGVDSEGLYALQGNQDGNPAEATFAQRLSPPGSGNTIQYLRGVGANSVSWFVPASLPGPTTFTARLRVVEGGNTSITKTVEYTVTDRTVSQSQTSEVVATNLPNPPGGTRDETITFAYDAGTTILTIGTTGLSQNTTNDVTQIGMEVTYNDTQSLNTSSTSSKIRFGQQDEHRANTVDILLEIRADNPNETTADKRLEILAIIDGYQENTLSLNFRASDYDFSDIVFGPDSGDAISIANIQVYEWDDAGNPFNAPTHAQLYNMWVARNRWLGLFLHPSEDYREYTIAGGMILTDKDDNTFNVINGLANRVREIFQAANTSSLSNSVVLPSDFADFNLLHVTEFISGSPNEWRTVTIVTPLLTEGDVSGSDSIRVQGNTDISWTSGTRTIATVGGASTIYRIQLMKL